MWNETVQPLSANQLTVAASTPVTAGGNTSVTVTAKDIYGNRDTNDNDAITYVTSDPQNASVHGASLSTGQVIFNTPLYTVGTRYVNATDSGHTIGSTQSNAVTVNPGGATHFSVSVPGSATAGSPFTFTVTALDFYNNTATGYTGTVHFTSSDGQAIVPGDYAFVGGDAGVHTFSNGATLKTAGSRTITATDTVTGSITGTSASITVSAAGATHFAVSAPASATAGNAFSFTVTALVNVECAANRPQLLNADGCVVVCHFRLSRTQFRHRSYRVA